MLLMLVTAVFMELVHCLVSQTEQNTRTLNVFLSFSRKVWRHSRSALEWRQHPLNLVTCVPNYVMSRHVTSRHKTTALISATLRTSHFPCLLLWFQSTSYITVVICSYCYRLTSVKSTPRFCTMLCFCTTMWRT